MATVYILCGIPASGKSTWGQQFYKTNPHIKYISRDDIRFSIIKPEEEYFSHEDEVFYQFVKNIAKSLLEGVDVIADATHLNRFSRMKLIDAIDKYTQNYDIVFVVFETNLDICLKRNQTRSGRSIVPEENLKNMYKHFRRPTLGEDFRVKEIVDVNGDLFYQ